MSAMRVWIVTTHAGWGENTDVFGVFASKETARNALAAKYPAMTFEETDYGFTGESDEHRYATAEQYDVKP